MRRLNIILTICVVLGCTLQGNSQTCTLKTSPGKPDKEFDAIFTQNGPGTGLEPAGGPGWIGADSTYSILLPNGDSAFFFSDSYIGEYPRVAGDGSATADANGLRRREANCHPPLCDPPTSLFRAHNSIVVRSATTGQLRTLVGPKDPDGLSTSYFTPANAPATHFYWMGDSVVGQTGQTRTNKLWVIVMEFDAKFTYYGSALAQLSLPDLRIESLKPLRGTDGSTVAWGSSLWLERSQGSEILYIYGMQNKLKLKVPYVARVNPALGFNAVTDAHNWTTWNGSTWVRGLVNAVQLIGGSHDPNNAGDQISDEFNVRKIRTRKGSVYILVGMDTTVPYGKWKDITLYSACRPQGPFSSKQVVYSTPEAETIKVPGMSASQSLAGPLLVYNPHSHPQFNDKRGLLISYNLNTTKAEDLLYADTYRPRFIRVPIEGL